MSKVVKLTCELLLISGNVLCGSVACGLGCLRCNRVLLSITSRAISSFEGREHRNPFFFFFFSVGARIHCPQFSVGKPKRHFEGLDSFMYGNVRRPFKKEEEESKEGKKHTRNRFPHYRSRARIISVLSKNLYL